MNDALPTTLGISKRVPTRVGKAALAGHNYRDARGRWFVRLGLKDERGERGVDYYLDDFVQFAGATWRVAKVYEPTAANRGPVADLVRVLRG